MEPTDSPPSTPYHSFLLEQIRFFRQLRNLERRDDTDMRSISIESSALQNDMDMDGRVTRGRLRSYEQNVQKNKLLDENDPNRLWCVCRRPHGNQYMIRCDACEDWFHVNCVKVGVKQVRDIMKKNCPETGWICPGCLKSVSSPLAQINMDGQ